MSSSRKMSAQQKILLLEWLEKPENRWAQNTHLRDNSQTMMIKKWEEVAVILNSCRFGSTKVGEKWMKTFKELRSHIRKKHRTYIVQQRAGHNLPSTLSQTDQRFLSIFKTACDHDSEIPPVIEDKLQKESKIFSDMTETSPSVGGGTDIAEICPDLEKSLSSDMGDNYTGVASPELANVGAELSNVGAELSNVGAELSSVGETSTNTEEVWVHQDEPNNFNLKLEDEVVWPDSDEDIFLEEPISPKHHGAKKKKSPELKKEPYHYSQCERKMEADIVAQSWAMKLNRLDAQQRLLAEKFINDIIFEAELGNLHRDAVRIN